MTPADVSGLLQKHRELEALVALHNWWLGAFTAIVALGILAEILVEFWYSKDKPRAEIILTVICSLVVFGGVIGEWIESGKVADKAGELQQMADKDVGQLYEQASRANERAGKAEAMNSELEFIFDPRRFEIPSDQIASTKDHPKASVLIFTVSDIEAKRLALDIETELNSCGWQAKIAGKLSDEEQLKIPDGVSIVYLMRNFSTIPDAPMASAANDLSWLLENDGISAPASRWPPEWRDKWWPKNLQLQRTTLYVFVGEKDLRIAMATKHWLDDMPFANQFRWLQMKPPLR